MAYSFTYRGIRSEDLDLEILDVRRGVLPVVDPKTLNIPGRPGTFFMRSEYGARTFEVDILIKKQLTTTALQLKVRDIANFLDAEPGLGELIFDDETDKKYNAIVTGQTPADQIVDFRMGTITFLAPFPFAESLVQEEFEINGFQAAFTRATFAYGLDGRTVAPGDPRYEKGLFGDGIIIEEFTSNGFTADLSSFESAASLSAVTPINSTLSRDIKNQFHGSYSLKMDTDGQVIGEGFTTVSIVGIASSTTFTISLFAIANRSSTIHMVIKEFDAGLVQVGTTTSSDFVIPDESQPLERIFVTFTTTGTTTSITLEVLTSTAIQYRTIWFDGLQIEINNYVTSWQEGQITRNDETLAIPLRSLLQNVDSIKEGTIEFEFSRINASSDTFSALLDWGAFTVGNTLDRIVILHGTSIGTSLQTISFQIVNGTDNALDTISITLPNITGQGDFFYVAIRWDLPGTLKIDVYDYKNATHFSNSKTTTINPLTFRDPPLAGNDFPNGFLGTSGLTFWVNAIYDEFRTTNRIRSDAEILAAPLRTRPQPVDEPQIGKLTMDETFALHSSDMSNEGTAPVFHVITVVMQSAATFVQVTLQETGQFLRIDDNTLTTDDKIVFNAIDKTLVKNDTVDLSLLSLDSEFFELPKDDNAFVVTSDGTVLAKIEYTPTFL